MPPKGRGRGGARGRGAGRGGAASSTRSDADAPALASTSEASASVGAPASEPAVADTNVAPTVEPHPTSVSASPVTSAQTAPSTSNKPPRQRLDSLKNTESASRSASPSARRGSSTRSKKVVALPTFSGRRSKEEREARTAADKQRDMERNKERDRLAEKRRIAKERDAKRLAERASRGRGGYSGAVSGPFSMQSARQDKRTTRRNFGGSGSGSRATRVKDEHYDHGGSSNRHGGPSGSRSIEEEDGDEASSDDDQNAEFPRKDIDLIELSSDEDDPAPSTRPRTHLPVRIGRKEHKERVVGINTDASTETSARLFKEESQADSAPPAPGENVARKGKGKEPVTDLEIVGERQHARGAKQDDEVETKIKSETASEDEEMEDAVQVGISSERLPTEKVESPPTAERKPKIREKKAPQLQTDEERAEWARFQANLSHVRAELGPDDEPLMDASGDTKMNDASTDANRPSRRDDHVYLFQLPPIIPELKGPPIKKEPSSAGSKASEASKAANGEAVPIKKEEEFSNPLGNIAERPNLASGRVGKLRVHQSGRTTLDWGGIDFELAPGKPVSFLQEVVSMHMMPEKDRVTAEDAGTAVSLGRVKGKFVVTPDFSSIFG